MRKLFSAILAVIMLSLVNVDIALASGGENPYGPYNPYPPHDPLPTGFGS